MSRIPTASGARTSGDYSAPLRSIARAKQMTNLAVGALALTLVAIFVAQRQSAAWVQHSREVARDTRNALSLAIDEETGLRGYLLAGDERLLAPEQAAAQALPGLLARLVAATADNAGQQRHAKAVAEAVRAWRREFAEPVIKAPERFRGEQERRDWALNGKESFDAVRAQFASVLEAEDRLYVQRRRRDDALRLWGAGLLLLEIAAIGMAAQWADRRLLAQADEILTNNAQLEEQAVELELTMEEAQQSTREREEAFAVLDAALGSAPTAFAFVDEAELLNYRNAAFSALLSGTVEHTRAARVADLAHGVSEPLTAAVAAVRASRQPQTGLTLATHPDGDGGTAGRRTWNASCYPVIAAGRNVGVGIVATETTAQLRLESELRQSQKMDAIGQLSGAVAHDFNNILTVINSYGEMLLEDMEPSRQRRDIEQIVKAGHRASVLTKQLLTFSRKESLQPEAIDVTEVVRGLEDMLRRLIGENIQIVTRLVEKLPAVVADAGQLEQVIVNLALNGRDAMPSGGMLLLETATSDITEEDVALHPGLVPGPYVVIAVSDTGIGMDAETQARVFEPFFTTKEKGQGTGIGLTTVYGIIRQAGGHVAVYSEPDEGTTFRIWLPVASEPVRILTPSGGIPRVEHAGGSKTILVADDDESVREVVVRVLERHGHSVLLASSGSEALETCGRLARERRPLDLLISDVIMPEMSGPALAEQVRLLFPGVRVLFMSGYTGSHLTGADLPEGVTAFVEKPFTVDALTERVARTLRMTPEESHTWSPSVPGSLTKTPQGRAAREMARRAVETERRAAAAAQRVIEARHRALMDALAEGIMLVDASGVVQMSNPSATLAMGNGGTILGSHLRDLPVVLTDEDGAPIGPDEHPVMRALRVGEVPLIVFGTRPLGTHDAPSRWWLGRARSLPNADGDASFGAVWSFGDITERKRAEDALQVERLFIATVLENVSDGVIACDALGATSLFNEAARELLGRAELGIVAPDWSRHFAVAHPDGTPFEAEQLPLARALHGEVVRDVELVVTRPDGTCTHLVSSARPLQVEGAGVRLGAVVALHDITMQKRTEAELKQALDDAQAASQVKYDFLIQMSHELRTPLNSVIGFAGTLLKNRGGRFNDQDLLWLSRIQTAGRQLLQTFEDILLVVEGGSHHSVELETTDLGALLHSVAGEFGESHRAGRVRLRVEVPPHLPMVRTNPQELGAATKHLVSNALKFTEQGEVVIRAERAGDDDRLVAIVVSDTGPGIPPEHQAAMFEPFKQADAGESRGHDGAGLGLSVALVHCRRINAVLSAESRQGNGATFRIVLGDPVTEGPRPGVDGAT